MNHSLCREFISYLDQDKSLMSGNAPEQVQIWFENLGLPMDLLRFMQWDWPQNDCEIAHLRILSSSSIYTDEVTPYLLKYKLLNVGNAPNGDWFVIDFSTDNCVPGFVSHEEWSDWDEDQEDPREYFEPIARTFDSFLYRVVERRYLPTNYYAAQDFNTFLASEKAS